MALRRILVKLPPAELAQNSVVDLLVGLLGLLQLLPSHWVPTRRHNALVTTRRTTTPASESPYPFPQLHALLLPLGQFGLSFFGQSLLGLCLFPFPHFSSVRVLFESFARGVGRLPLLRHIERLSLFLKDFLANL